MTGECYVLSETHRLGMPIKNWINKGTLSKDLRLNDLVSFTCANSENSM